MEFNKVFSVLENNIQHLLLDINRKNKKLTELEQALDLKQQNLDKLKTERILLNEQIQNLQLNSALSGNSEHKRLMKSKINRIIREVDNCIENIN